MTAEEEMKELFLKNSKKVVCPKCNGVWRILKWERRPIECLLVRKCPYCNPLGIR